MWVFLALDLLAKLFVFQSDIRVAPLSGTLPCEVLVWKIWSTRFWCVLNCCLCQISSACLCFPDLISPFNTIHLGEIKSSTGLNHNTGKMQDGRHRRTRKNAQVRSGDVEPGGTTAVARGPERALPRPGRGLALPAATWHRTRSQGSIMQAWPSNPEQGRDSYIHQQAPFSRQTWGKSPLLPRLSFWETSAHLSSWENNLPSRWFLLMYN